MSKKRSNVHPDHYKTAGREPQGRAVPQEVNRRMHSEEEARKEREANKGSPDAAPPPESEEKQDRKE